MVHLQDGPSQPALQLQAEAEIQFIPPQLPSQVKHSQPQPLGPPGEPQAHHLRGSKLEEAGPSPMALPRTLCLAGGDGGTFQSHLQALTPHSLWRKPQERGGGLEYCSSWVTRQDHAHLCPRDAQEGLGKGSTTYKSKVVADRERCGVQQLEQLRDEPRRG